LGGERPEQDVPHTVLSREALRQLTNNIVSGLECRPIPQVCHPLAYPFPTSPRDEHDHVGSDGEPRGTLVEEGTRLPVAQRLAVVAVICALAALAIGLHYAGDVGPRGFDTSIKNALAAHLSGSRDLLTFLVLPTQPYVLVPVIVLVVAVCLAVGRRQDAILAAVGPAIAVSANTWVLKPFFDREAVGPGVPNTLAYPSGHTVSLVSTLVVLVVLARPGIATAVTAVVGAVLLVAAGIGMIGLGYHYFTDIAGGFFFAVAAIFALRITISRLRPAREPSTG
jgi:membrane-associated phospholipid phosphatase